MFNDFGKAFFAGATATALASAIGSSVLSVFWALTASQPSVGWIFISIFAVVIPAAICGTLIGSVIFALVNVLTNLLRIKVGPVSYAAVAFLLAGGLAYAFAIKNGGEGVNILPILVPLPILAAGFRVGGIIARSRSSARS